MAYASYIVFRPRITIWNPERLLSCSSIRKSTDLEEALTIWDEQMDFKKFFINHSQQLE